VHIVAGAREVDTEKLQRSYSEEFGRRLWEVIK